MARPLRIEFDGALYHVTSRGNARAPIFIADASRVLFLDILKKTCDRFNWLCHAYCLMDNHYHLVIGNARRKPFKRDEATQRYIYTVIQQEKPEGWSCISGKV